MGGSGGGRVARRAPAERLGNPMGPGSQRARKPWRQGARRPRVAIWRKRDRGVIFCWWGPHVRLFFGPRRHICGGAKAVERRLPSRIYNLEAPSSLSATCRCAWLGRWISPQGSENVLLCARAYGPCNACGRTRTMHSRTMLESARQVDTC